MRHDAHGYWIEEAGLEGTPSLPSLTEDTSADVLIVGGGYTGLWSAWWVKQAAPDARVVILEADHCGFGPSGRNGGFVNSMSFSLPTLRRSFGDRDALRMVHAGDESVLAIGRWCEEQDVDAWFTHGGYLQASTAPPFDDAWDAVAEACAELGEEGRIEVLDGASDPGPLRLAALPGGRLLPEGGDRPAGAPRRRAAGQACSRPASRSTSARRSTRSPTATVRCSPALPAAASAPARRSSPPAARCSGSGPCAGR